MIERHESVSVGAVEEQNLLTIEGNSHLFKDALFFDLEHYIYKKPICVGVFGCCYFNTEKSVLEVTQYMIENKNDIKSILRLAREYFKTMYEKHGKRYIITFSGNNDFTVINYLFEKYKIGFDINEHFFHLDLQKQYEKQRRESIGLKALEKEFSIFRDSELISGSNLAKTFSKIIKDSDYISRMPEDKKGKILLYNQQDVVSLFHIYVSWNSVVANKELDESAE